MGNETVGVEYVPVDYGRILPTAVKKCWEKGEQRSAQTRPHWRAKGIWSVGSGVGAGG